MVHILIAQCIIQEIAFKRTRIYGQIPSQQKVVHNLFHYPPSEKLFQITTFTSITPILFKLNFRHHTPQNSTFWKVGNLHFGGNIPFAGLNSKFLSTQQNFHVSPTQILNMKSIGWKLMKWEQNMLSRFFFPSQYNFGLQKDTFFIWFMGILGYLLEIRWSRNILKVF